MERRLEIKVLEVIQSTCNDTTNSIQFENFREIKRKRERERELLSLLSRSWSKSSEWSAMDMNKAVKLSLSLSLSHLEDTHGVFKTVVE